MNIAKTSYEVVLEQHQRLGLIRRGLYAIGAALAIWLGWVMLDITFNPVLGDGARAISFVLAVGIVFPGVKMALRAISGRR